MTHPIHRVTRFTIVGPYTLIVAFSDGTEQRIDFKPVLRVLFIQAGDCGYVARILIIFGA